MRNKNCQRGNIAVVVALVGLGIVTLGIFAGKTLVDIGTRLLPKAQAPATNSLSFLPEADSYIDKSAPNQNYGKLTTIRVNGSSSVTREGYLRFNISGIEGPVTKAEFYLTSDDEDADDGPAIYLADNTWTETGITYNNRPAKAVEKIADLKNIEEDQTVIVDITSVIAGNGMYTLALIPTSSDGIRFFSREAASKRPSLTVTFELPTPTCVPKPLLPHCDAVGPEGTYISCDPTPPPGGWCPEVTLTPTPSLTETPTPTVTLTITPTPTMCAMPTPPFCENGTLKASSETQTWGVCPPKYICVTPTPSCIPMPEECYVNQGAGTPTIACSAPPGGWCPVTPTKVPITTVVCTKRKYGDANCDGKISGVDYSVWLNSQCYQNTGKTCLDLRADFNQDNYIDGLDFVIWLNKRGKK